MTRPERLIIVGGPPGSGKDTAGDYLAIECAMQHISGSDVLRTEARRQGVGDPIPRDVLGKISDDLHNNPTIGTICRLALDQFEQVAEEYPGGLVISGLRRLSEARACKANQGSIIYLDAPIERRFELVNGRKRGDDPDSFEEFLQRDQMELNGTTSEGKHGIYLLGIRELADVIIENTSSKDDLYHQIDNFINTRP